MVWVLIIGGLFVVAAISYSSKKASEVQERAEHGELFAARAEAYQDYLRRTSDNKEFKAMTDNELKEFIFSAMRDYNKKLNELTPFNAPKYAELRLVPSVLLGGFISNCWNGIWPNCLGSI